MSVMTERKHWSRSATNTESQKKTEKDQLNGPDREEHGKVASSSRLGNETRQHRGTENDVVRTELITERQVEPKQRSITRYIAN